MYKIGLVIVISLLVCVLFNSILLAHWNENDVFTRISIIVAISAGLYIAYRLNLSKIQKNFQRKNIVNKKRIKQKMWALTIIWLLSVLFSYTMFKYLSQPLYFYYYFDSLIFSPFILITLYFWVKYLDQRQTNPNDQYALFFIDIHNKEFSLKKYKLFLLSNAVKIFYIPFVYGATFLAISQLLALDNIWQNPSQFIIFLFLFGICFDVTIALGGYIFSSQFFSTETLSVDDTWQGWLVCLICYPPLLIIFKFLTSQVDDFIWSDWLNQNQILYWIWAFLICLTWVCYWLATVSFGFRFSNLSWRGLINTGLYRYTKHPAYIAKNIYWWMHTVPFFGVVGFDIWRNILALSCVSLVYYFRAKTEECHLMRFSEYREYQQWIAKNGLWAKIKNIK